MRSLSDLRSVQLWLRLLHLVQPLGFCHVCQRMTAWLDGGSAYRCRQCGLDPLAGAC